MVDITPLAMVGGALTGGYAVGALPVGWLVVRRTSGVDIRRQGTGRAGSLAVLGAGGPRALVLTLALELLKGAVVGVGAHAISDGAWFVATAIAGCVVGDAFPIVARRSRRGVAPLVSGTLAAMPGAWVAGLLVAIPAVLVFTARRAVFEGVVAVAVPAGFVLGTRDWRTLPAALIIVVALVLRSRLRRAARAAALAELRRIADAGRPTVLDAPAWGPPPPR